MNSVQSLRDVFIVGSLVMGENTGWGHHDETDAPLFVMAEGLVQPPDKVKVNFPGLPFFSTTLYTHLLTWQRQ